MQTVGFGAAAVPHDRARHQAAHPDACAASIKWCGAGAKAAGVKTKLGNHSFERPA